MADLSSQEPSEEIEIGIVLVSILLVKIQKNLKSSSITIVYMMTQYHEIFNIRFSQEIHALLGVPHKEF